jgi:hypothetical protein
MLIIFKILLFCQYFEPSGGAHHQGTICQKIKNSVIRIKIQKAAKKLTD